MSEAQDKSPRSAEGQLEEVSMISTIGLVVGALGGAAIIFGALLFFIDPGATGLVTFNLIFGALAGVFYGLTNRITIARVVSGRSTPLVLLEAVLVVGLLAAAAAANYFAANSTVEWDLTRDTLFTLEEQSIKVASAITEDVTIIGFFRPSDPKRRALTDLVELYGRHTKRITVEFVNPEAAAPGLLKKYKMGPRSPRIVLATGDDRNTKVKEASEESITNALIQLTDRSQRKVYFLTGHGEPDIDDKTSVHGYGKARQDLLDEGYLVEKLSLSNRENIPKDASVVLVVAPQRPPLPNEIQTLKAWLRKGGRVMVMLEPMASSGLESLLSQFGVKAGNDIVWEPKTYYVPLREFAPVIDRYEVHPITGPLKGLKTVFTTARSVSPMLGVARATSTTLIQTSSTSWAETQIDMARRATLDEDDMFGPVPIAQAVTIKTVATPGKINDEARLVVFGDSSFAANGINDLAAGGDLLLNATNWLAGEERRIAIRPRRRGACRLPLTEGQHYGIVFLSLNVLPLMILGFGFSVWATRRRK